MDEMKSKKTTKKYDTWIFDSGLIECTRFLKLSVEKKSKKNNFKFLVNNFNNFKGKSLPLYNLKWCLILSVYIAAMHYWWSLTRVKHV